MNFPTDRTWSSARTHLNGVTATNSKQASHQERTQRSGAPHHKLRELTPAQEGNIMSEMHPSAPAYALGYTPEAFQRLLVQGRLYRPFMRRLLEAAGLSAGMHVLDVGCGPGEVSLLAAELVGELGIVIGVDRDESTIHIAQGRAQEAGLKNLSFLLGDLNEFTSTQS